MGSNWLRVARDKDANAVLQRKQELESIAEQLKDNSQTIEDLEAVRQSNEQQLHKLEEQRKEIAANTAQQQQNYAELRSKLSGFGANRTVSSP